MANPAESKLPRPSASADVPVLIGRRKELDMVLDALRITRCVSIVGPGGMGKTALAINAAHMSQGKLVDEVYFVSLSEAQSADVMLITLARALRVTLQPEPEWSTQISAHLHDVSALILFDNFEQLIPQRQILQCILDTAPGVRMLITSREPVNLNGECVITLHGLSLLAESPNVLSPAEHLFEVYARRCKPSFITNSVVRPQVLRICKLVDGMPLAIELAAAWVSLLPVHFIANQIEQNIDWLSTSLGFTYQEHKSVRAVLDYFWNILSPDEQTCVQALSVFADGFEADMALAVANASTEFLSVLVQRAFLSTTTTGRYAMHPLLKQYACGRLTRDVTFQREVQQRHANTYLALAKKAQPELKGAAQIAWAARLELESANIRAALTWWLSDARSAHAIDNAHQMIHALHLFWYQNGHGVEGSQWFNRAINASAEETHSLVDVLTGATFLSAVQGDHAVSRARGLLALALAEKWQDQQRIGAVLHNLAFNETYVENYAEAIELYERSLAIDRVFGDVWSISVTVHNLGEAYFATGDLVKAEVLLRESIALGKSLGDEVGISYSVALLTQVLYETTRERDCLSELAQALHTFHHAEDMTGAIMAMESAALVTTRSDQFASSVVLFGASAKLRELHRIQLDAHMRVRFGLAFERLRSALGQALFDKTWQEGAALTRNEALALAESAVRRLIACFSVGQSGYTPSTAQSAPAGE